MGKTLHPTPYTPHPAPTNKLFQQTLILYSLARVQERLSQQSVIFRAVRKLRQFFVLRDDAPHRPGIGNKKQSLLLI